MRREFYHTYGVHYHECDCYGFLTPTSFVRYMQDISALDSEDVQLAGDGFWVVKRSAITFNAPIAMHTQLEVKTFGLHLTRITAQRGYEARIAGDSTGEPVISARTLWVYVDKRGRPARIPTRTAEIWLPDGPVPAIVEEVIPTPTQDSTTSIETHVRFSDTDVMRHMNNTAYVEVLDNAAWETQIQMGITPDQATLHVRSYDIEYLGSALLGEKMEIQTEFDPMPTPGETGMRLQQIIRNDSVIVRAASSWQWSATTQ